MSSVSVIVPCYNYGRFLRQCVGSVLMQTGVEVSVLIIDDASPDGSAAVARKLASADPRVEVICHERNQGHIATYNEGLERATGDYLLLLSADDYLTAGSLARAASVMDARPQVGLVYGRAVGDDDDPAEPPAPASRTLARVVPGHRWIAERCEQMNNVVPTPTAVVRTSLQHRLGGYRPDSPYAGDLEMWLRLAAHSDVAEVRSTQAVYRQHGANMSVQWVSVLEATFEHSRRAYETVLNEHASAIPHAPLLRAVVLRQVARRALRMATNRYCRGAAEPEEAAWLEAHAGAVYPGVRRLPEWWALQACKALGPHAAEAIGPAVDAVRRPFALSPA